MFFIKVTRFSGDDLAVVSHSFAATRRKESRHVEYSGNFSADIIKGVAHRCSHGYPQVLLCAAEKAAEPFPTTFWLVCPHLTRIAAWIEAQNGVTKLEESLRGHEKPWRKYHVKHSLLRLSMIPEARRKFLRTYRRRIYSTLRCGGVGGILYAARAASGSRKFSSVTAKCIHLQLASYLGFGQHPASDWLKNNISSWECDGGVCSARRKFCADGGIYPPK
ncbi:MAG: DUF501 domain-containing protein [Synergistaceae bacterium]|jgi:hypothetical protein|nr:DUF501 domain-containing protein [Synergistaceae bacterium]